MQPATVLGSTHATVKHESLDGRRLVVLQPLGVTGRADGPPLIGPVPGLRNAYVATGHSVWGMLNAPGTAIALSDLMLTGKSPRIDLTPFAPDRLAPLDPADLEMR